MHALLWVLVGPPVLIALMAFWGRLFLPIMIVFGIGYLMFG